MCCADQDQSVMKRSEFFIQAEERVRRVIVDLGGAENIIELRMKKKKKNKNKAAASKCLMDVPVVRETHLSFLSLLFLSI